MDGSPDHQPPGGPPRHQGSLVYQPAVTGDAAIASPESVLTLQFGTLALGIAGSV